MKDNLVSERAQQQQARKELVAAADGIVGVLRENAPFADKERRLHDASVQAMHDAGLFRVCAPRKFGGYEGDIRTYMDAVSEIGRGCGSSSWVAFISNMGAWMAGFFSEQAQKDIFDGNPDARFIGVLAATGTAEKVDGGYKVNGTWGYASGSLQAQWALMTARTTNAEGKPSVGLVLLPMDQTTIEDTWFCVGVRGSGSNTVSVKDVLVPEHRFLAIEDVMNFNALGDQSRSLPFRQPFAIAAIIGAAAPPLGMAKAALEYTRDRMNAGNKRIAYSTITDTRQSVTMQVQMAEAAALIGAGEALIETWCDYIVEHGAQGIETPWLERVRMRAEIGIAVKQLRDGVDLLLSIQGASAFMESNPVQRCWRDIEAGTRHGLLSPEVPLEIYGRALFDDPKGAELSAYI